MIRLTRFFSFTLCLLAMPILHAQDEVIQLNDNLISSGSLEYQTLRIDLVAEEGMWYPGGADMPGAAMQAFREGTGPLQVPGPFLRVEQGTRVIASITNAMPETALHFHGFQSRPDGAEESLVIPHGETRTAQFTLNSPGVFYYWGSTEEHELEDRRGIDSLLSGVIVVDPPDEKIEGRFFVILEGSSVPGKREHGFNGASFPNTERMQVVVGETNTWHFINTSFAAHPLHLHGTFYRVTHRGSLLDYGAVEPRLMREQVTAQIGIGEVMTMAWHTDRTGNWLFHCHISAHVAADDGRLSSGDDFHVEPDASGLHEMAGMTLAINAVSNGNPPLASASPQREITMRMQAVENYFGDNTGFATAFDEAGRTNDAPVAPGPVLVLNEGESVSINLINQLPEATSIHWHGMELASYYDGVAGFSGTIGSLTPAIAPGESFIARMTPPRAGTYIYHTHMDDRTQLVRGLYGALIVQSPEFHFDPAIDKVFVMGLAGDAIRTAARVEGMVINGTTNSITELHGLQQYRLRLVNITANNSEFMVRLIGGGGEVQQWTLIGKDGAMLPAYQQISSTAERQPVSVGETYDFAWTPADTGPYWLEVRRDDGEWMAQARLNVQGE